MTNPENPPAFPSSYGDPRNPGWIGGGMTLRDAAALAALQGMCSATDSTGLWTAPLKEPVIIVQHAFAIADAFLEARNKTYD